MGNVNLFELELYWMEVLQRDEKMLETLQDQADIRITTKFIDFMKMILKYGNLNDKIIVDGQICKRVIRIHRNIPTVYLDVFGYEYIIFSGLYVVLDVVFYDPSILNGYFDKKCNEEEHRKLRMSLGIPDNVMHNIPRIVNINKTDKCCFLVRNKLTEDYVTWQSNWSFPTFGRNKESQI